MDGMDGMDRVKVGTVANAKVIVKYYCFHQTGGHSGVRERNKGGGVVSLQARLHIGAVTPKLKFSQESLASTLSRNKAEQ